MEGYTPFDEATQVRTGPDRVVTGEAVTDTYTVRNKTAPEVDADKENQLDSNLLNNPFFKAFAKVCANQFGMTAAQLKAAIKAEM